MALLDSNHYTSIRNEISGNYQRNYYGTWETVSKQVENDCKDPSINWFHLFEEKTGEKVLSFYRHARN